MKSAFELRSHTIAQLNTYIDFARRSFARLAQLVNFFSKDNPGRIEQSLPYVGLFLTLLNLLFRGVNFTMRFEQDAGIKSGYFTLLVLLALCSIGMLVTNTTNFLIYFIIGATLSRIALDSVDTFMAWRSVVRLQNELSREQGTGSHNQQTLLAEKNIIIIKLAVLLQTTPKLEPQLLFALQNHYNDLFDQNERALEIVNAPLWDLEHDLQNKQKQLNIASIKLKFTCAASALILTAVLITMTNPVLIGIAASIEGIELSALLILLYTFFRDDKPVSKKTAMDLAHDTAHEPLFQASYTAIRQAMPATPCDSRETPAPKKEDIIQYLDQAITESNVGVSSPMFRPT